MKIEKDLEKKFNDLLNKLYESEFNRMYSNDLNAKLRILLSTPSINRWFIYKDSIYIYLTEEWIKYIEEKRMSILKKIIHHINKFWNFYTIMISISALIISIISLFKK